MKPELKFASLTIPQGHAPRMIVSPIKIACCGRMKAGVVSKMSSMAQWDTGADYCMISATLAQRLHLTSQGTSTVNTANGSDCIHATYLVDIFLPNGIIFTNVVAIEDENLDDTGVDFLIGLDIINTLDFAITHDKTGATVLSISYPPCRLVDFRN